MAAFSEEIVEGDFFLVPRESVCSVELLEIGNFELKRPVFQRFLSSLFAEGRNFSPDTWAAGVAPSLDCLALVAL